MSKMCGKNIKKQAQVTIWPQGGRMVRAAEGRKKVPLQKVRYMRRVHSRAPGECHGLKWVGETNPKKEM